MSCGQHKHPLKRSGTNQQQRLPAALKENYIQIDEKSFADWIVFASDFSAFLKYFNNADQAINSWKPFFTSDISAILGLVAIQDVDYYRLLTKSKLDDLKSEDHKNEPGYLKETFALLFSSLLTLSYALDNLLLHLPDDPPLKFTIQNLIQVKLRSGLYRLLGYYKYDANLLSEKDDPDWKILNQPVRTAKSIIIEGLSKDWIYPWNPAAPPDPDWITYYNNISPDGSIYGSPANNLFHKINHAANHNLFTGIFDQFLTAYAKIIKSAEAALMITLSKWDSHTPHYALFLSFLRLYRTAQGSINTIKKRHLDFYYRETLRLEPSDAQANHTHIVIELAKQVDDYLLKKGTEFKAGKDSLGKDVVYALDKDSVFNKAKIAKLMAVYEHTGHAGDYFDPVKNDKRLFAAPAINSADGLGAKLTTSQGEWHPFANKTYVDGNLFSVDMPEAQIGFAVASHYLFLTEGERKVFLKLATSNNNALLNLSADCYLTTPKGWYKIGTLQATAGTMSDNSSCIILSFTLPVTEPPITSYNAAVHGGVFNCELPILKIYLKQDNSQVYQYDNLKEITVTKIEVEVQVGDSAGYTDNGLKQLLLFSDMGQVDGSKPFQPFGAQPNKDTGFIIGNKEVFSKKHSKITLNIEWANLPDSFYDINYNTIYDSTKQKDGTYVYGADPYEYPYFPKVGVQFLQGNWSNKNDNMSVIADADIFNTNNIPTQVVTPGQEIPSKSTIDFSEEDYVFDSKSSNGFLRLVLNSDFGHKQYFSDLTSYLLDKSKSNYYPKDVGVLPILPYTPVIKSLYLSYTASVLEDLTSSDEVVFDNRSIRFFHIYPFGETEQHSQINGESTLYLLPQFKYIGYNEETKLNEIHPSVGEFYLGFENLNPGQSLSLLFQVLEGSTNPLVQKPVEHVRWSYLSSNKWITFKSSSVADQTKQLIQSGLIEFAIPEDATNSNCMLPSGFIWLRASISEAPDVICKILDIFPQSAKVTFKPNDNASDYLNSPLPAKTISKLKEPLSAIKKIDQPYSSFGGLPAESDAHFYIRVSERLRHKDRAITIWDYERMVLEAFPQIHKVKCISHTKLIPDDKNPGEKIYSELAPGYVTVITIPDLKNRNDTDPLKPYTNTDLLVNIRNFLESKTTCHAKIITENPLFEEIRMEFTLQLVKGFDDKVFYKKLMQQEITQFLTPWAYDSSVDVQFGGKVYKSVLINFIEERPYVDFITDVKLYHTIDQVESGDNEEVVGSTERSVLVSAPASHHDIFILPDVADPVIDEKCEAL